jgi:hypothetical protein
MSLPSGKQGRMVTRRPRRVRRGLLGLAVAGLALAACDGERMTVGVSPAPVEVPDATIESGDQWTGYLEGFRFASGSDRLTLTFDSPTSGTMLFGEGSPVAPEPTSYGLWAGAFVGQRARPFDPHAEYDYFPLHDHPEVVRSAASFYERFRFTLRDVTYDGSRIAFRIDLHEAWTSWCASRRPSCTVDLSRALSPPTPETTCGCVDPSDRAYDAYQAVCYTDFRACRCSKMNCEVDLRNDLNGPIGLVDPWHLRFDLRIRGPMMTGTSELGEVVVEKSKATR